MDRTISEETLRDVIAFHGHQCPGLAIGIRVAEYAKKLLPEADSTSLVCVTETDMCGVDGIQFLTGCTYGKGNLIHRDYGKTAFSFYSRVSNKGVRMVLNESARGSNHSELSQLMAANGKGTITEEERARLQQLRKEMEERIMTMPLEQLFTVTAVASPPPRAARVLASLTCESCQEQTMESRTRRFAGKTLCIPCFEKVEQKI